MGNLIGIFDSWEEASLHCVPAPDRSARRKTYEFEDLDLDLDDLEIGDLDLGDL